MVVIVALMHIGCRHASERETIVSATTTVEFDHQHPDLGKVLEEVVDDFGMVKYEELGVVRSDLEAYLNLTASVPRTQFDGWKRARRMAFLINVYNATTLKLLSDYFPVKSIKDIGGLRRVWDLEVVRLFGGKFSLGHLEHEMIRKQFKSPSIHFVLVCGSRGCPPLREEPYTADKLETQFSDQARDFLRDRKKNYIDLKSKTLFLSEIFMWFRDDFGKNDDQIIALVAKYFEATEQQSLMEGGFVIHYTKFDWRVNQSIKRK
jgi:hypothetical protein